jgi:staphylococcal nuclease domain-containing protein 1
MPLSLLVLRFLRKRLIGKTVRVYVDYVKPAEAEYDEKECVTIKYGGSET